MDSIGAHISFCQVVASVQILSAGVVSVLFLGCIWFLNQLQGQALSNWWAMEIQQAPKYPLGRVWNDLFKTSGLLLIFVMMFVAIELAREVWFTSCPSIY